MSSSEQPTGKNKISAAVRRRRLFILLPLACLLIWSSIKIVDNMLIAANKEQQLAELEQEHAELRQLKQHYQQQVTNLQDPIYREKKARELYNLAAPDEKIYSKPDSQR